MTSSDLTAEPEPILVRGCDHACSVSGFACHDGRRLRPSAQQAASTDDPYIWLEDVSGQRAMDWVNSHNAKTQAVLEADPRYQQFYDEALAIAQAKDRIPYGTFSAARSTISGRTPTMSAASGGSTSARRLRDPAARSGTTVLDLDALAKAEKANWVLKGATAPARPRRRCLISLSDGGEDAVTVREFDLATGKLRPGRLQAPQGQAGCDLGGREHAARQPRMEARASSTRSGYAYIVKRLKRGQPLSAAVEVFRGNNRGRRHGFAGGASRRPESHASVHQPCDRYLPFRRPTS